MHPKRFMDIEMKDGHHQQRTNKRFRKDDSEDPMNPDPSIVVHLRRLSPGATDADVLEVMQHFGQVAYVAVLQSRRMALVEFEDMSSAEKCVHYGKNNPITIAGSTVMVNFSTSKNIQRVGFESEIPNNVLVLHIQNCIYPMNVEIIHMVCKPHGEVLRIAVMQRPMGVLALVEFNSIGSASKAKHALNGADIYSGCCTLKVEFAKPETVRVTANDALQWDFTQSFGQMKLPNQFETSRKSLLNKPEGPANFNAARMMSSDDGGSFGNGVSGGGKMGFGGGRGGYFDNEMQEGGNAFGMGGMKSSNSMRGDGSEGGMFMSGMAAGGGVGGFGGSGIGGGFGGAVMGGKRPIGGGGLVNSSMSGVMGGRGMGGMLGGLGPDMQDRSAVVMVYGLDQEHWSPDKVFNLFCQYGNVLKVKFMKSKEDTAMVEMGTPQQMKNLIDNVSNTIAFGSKLSIRPSKQDQLLEPREPFPLANGEPSFKDFSKDRNQRFSSPKLADKNRNLPVCSTLHFFNAPLGVTEQRMNEIMDECDAPQPDNITIFEGKPDARMKTGIMAFCDKPTAIEAIIKANHHTIPNPDGKYPYILKFAFAGGSHRE